MTHTTTGFSATTTKPNTTPLRRQHQTTNKMENEKGEIVDL